MDSTLVTVTVLSMGMAAALSVIVWRLLRDERRRSEARIAALTEASRLGPPSSALHAPEIKPVQSARPAAKPGVFKPEVFKPVTPAAAVPTERARDGRRSAADDLPLRPADAPPQPGSLFVEPERSSPWGSRLAVMAGLAMLFAAVVLVAMTAAKARPAVSVQAPAAVAVNAGAQPAGAGLELTSLRDARQDDTLTITGMVQNPRAGSPLARVAVIAYAFDDSGTFLASGRALIDVTSLAPGDESPFMVTVPVTGTVARYRIGFRSEDGRVIAHVDKRQQPPMAALRQPNG